MKTVLTLLKITAQLLLVFLFFVYTIIAMIFIHSQAGRRRLHSKTVSFIASWSCRVMNIKMNVINPPKTKENYLLLANHVGFMDIYMIASLRHSLFITSMDMKRTPGLGQIAIMGGCLFVDRKSRTNIHKEIAEIRIALEQGNDVVLFPEAMSTNGEKIHPFKKTLLRAAAGTTVPILPMVINFRKINGEPMSDKWRNYVAWYGKQSFAGAAWRAYSLRSIEVDVEFLDPIICKTDEERSQIASRAQTMVEQKYTPIPLPIQSSLV